MAIRYEGSGQIYYPTTGGGALNALLVNEYSGNIYYCYGDGSKEQIHEVYRKSGGVWQKVLHTDKYAPNTPPQSVYTTITPTTLGRHNIRVDWTNPAFSTTVGIYINYYNTTDPSKNGSVTISPLNAATFYTITDAGSSDDWFYFNLAYFEALESRPFYSPAYDTPIEQIP